jgi:hypothetical protein
MNAALQSLLQLQALEFGEVSSKGAEAQIATLRREVPKPILDHYDRLRVRGKKGVAIVRNSVCGGCHMQQTVSKVATLMRDEDIQLCDSCGRYLYLASPAEATAGEPKAAAAKLAAEARPAPKRRPRAARQPRAVKAQPAKAEPAKAAPGQPEATRPAKARLATPASPARAAL